MAVTSDILPVNINWKDYLEWIYDLKFMNYDLRFFRRILPPILNNLAMNLYAFFVYKPPAKKRLFGEFSGGLSVTATLVAE